MEFYLNQVLDAFSAMDALLIAELLDPDQTYAEVSLAIFSQKLDETFKKFRKFGDTFLEVETGNCCNLSCNPESIHTAYRFVGNYTRNYMDFRFLIEPITDGKEHNIEDIFECYSFKCLERKDWYGIQITLTIYEDEVFGYYLSPDEVIHTEIALKAVAEIHDGKQTFPLDEVESWLMKYRSTIEFIRENDPFQAERFLRWSPFFYMYANIEQYLSFFQKWGKTLSVEACKYESEIHEDYLIEVILDAERILVEVDQENLIIDIRDENPCRLRFDSKPFMGELADIFSLSWRWLKPLQEAMVRKYFALTETETDSYLEGIDYLVGGLRLLTFHLEIREKAKKRKGYIPFGLGEKTYDDLKKAEKKWGRFLNL